MRKLLILVTIALLVSASQAASIAWGNGTASRITGIDGTNITAANAAAWGLTVTLMCADGTATTATPITSVNAMNAGVLSGSTTWTYQYGTDAQNGDEFYIKALMTVDGTTYEMNIYADQANKKNFLLDLGANPNNTSTATFAWETGTYGGSMWTAQSIPEPTSGLLLLLGMAGLALRRKRA